MRRIVIAGASRGLGASLARHYTAAGDEVISLSRGPSHSGRWIACDLALPEQIESLPSTIPGPVDALLVVAGIWEASAFTPGYSFAASPVDEISRILAVNLQAPILLARAFLSQLAAGSPGRVVLVGSTSGLDNIGTPEVAYNASKAGLRGAAQALARALVAEGIPVAILNPGDIGTEDVLAAKESGSMREAGSLPPEDLLSAVDFLLNLSPETSFTEVNLLPLC